MLLAHKNKTNLKKALTMLIEEKYKYEDTGSSGVNPLSKLELSNSVGVCFIISGSESKAISPGIADSFCDNILYISGL